MRFNLLRFKLLRITPSSKVSLNKYRKTFNIMWYVDIAQFRVWFRKYSFRFPEAVIFIYIMFAEKQTISRNIKLDKTLSVIRLANPLEMHTTNRSQLIKRRYLPGLSVLFLISTMSQIHHVVIDSFYSFFHRFIDFCTLEGRSMEISRFQWYSCWNITIITAAGINVNFLNGS